MKPTIAPKRPILAYAKPTTCHWCSGTLEHIRNVYKGKDSERYYDSQNCLVRGEERALRKLAEVAGTVSSPWYVGLATILAVFMLAFAFTGGKTWAHNPDTHQADDLANAKSDAYGVCCNGQDYSRVETWETTPTGYRIMHKGQWYEASRSVKVSNMDNPDGEAKVWINGPDGGPFYVRCFMPGARS